MVLNQPFLGSWRGQPRRRWPSNIGKWDSFIFLNRKLTINRTVVLGFNSKWWDFQIGRSGAPRAKARGSSTCFVGRNPPKHTLLRSFGASKGTLPAIIHGLKTRGFLRRRVILLEKSFNGDDSDSGRANTVTLTIKKIFRFVLPFYPKLNKDIFLLLSIK